MATLAASAYFLTCCRPIFTSSFCYYIETPKFINLYQYPIECLIQNQFVNCTRHDKLSDHCLSCFNPCTDGRGWSLDREQQRLHFLDIICGRIPQCGCHPAKKHLTTNGLKGKEECPTIKTLPCEPILPCEPKKEEQCKAEEKQKSPETKTLPCEPKEEDKDGEKVESPETKEPTIQIEGEGFKPDEDPNDKPLGSQSEDDLKDTPCKDLSDTDLSAIRDCLDNSDKAEKPFEDELNKFQTPEQSPEILYRRQQVVPSSIDELVPNRDRPPRDSPSSFDSIAPYPKPRRLSFASDEDSKVTAPKESVAELTDDILEKLDCNLQNLESTFDRFVKKNRDFIQNLVECLNYEKQKQKALEKNYNKLKHENDVMRTKNEYLKMVNIKQLELFRDELDKGITENKTMYTKKIHHMELQMQTHQDQLHHYKKTERKYLEIVENESAEMANLKNEIKALKSKETALLRNYVKVLNFLEDVKETLYSSGSKGALPLQKSPLTINDSGTDPEVKEVLKIALSEGMQNLNVRDLSILHDAIQELNERLCHQNEFCGKNPTADLSIPQMSTMYSDQPDGSHYSSKGNRDYDTSSNLSIYPSRQKPDHHVRFSL